MSETTWALVIMSLINMIGSVSITWLRYYYRAHYKIENGDTSHGIIIPAVPPIEIRSGQPGKIST